MEDNMATTEPDVIDLRANVVPSEAIGFDNFAEMLGFLQERTSMRNLGEPELVFGIMDTMHEGLGYKAVGFVLEADLSKVTVLLKEEGS